MAVDSVVTNSSVGFDGNAYTTAVSNDQLTNDDFLKLMLEEMKMQDPTKPMDSSALMDSQLQMSSIQANMEMSDSMKALSSSYAATSLSTAASMIGHVVEDGTLGENGFLNSYKVDTVENRDGELFINGRVQTGIQDALVDSTDENSLVLYDSDGYLYDGDAKIEPNIRLNLDNNGRFTFNEDGKLSLLDENNEAVTDTDIIEKYLHAGSSAIYSTQRSTVAMSTITQVR